MSPPLVLVTGASGFVGSHIVDAAQDAGYPVRITVRPAKADAVKAQYGDRVEISVIADLVEGDYSDALKGVGAVIHAASPLPLRGQTGKEILSAGVNGTLNLLRQAAAAGVKRFVFTSSSSTLGPYTGNDVYVDKLLTDKDWNVFTPEFVGAPDTHPFDQYAGTKTLAEQAVWKFADEHPEIDVTTIVPPFLYGPLPRGPKFVSTTAMAAYSTLGQSYTELLQAPGQNGSLKYPQFTGPITLDVRDAARAHILALTAPASTEPGMGRKRIPLGGPYFTWRDATEHLAVSHPELAAQGRLKALGDSKRIADLKILRYDNSRAESVLGWKEFISWEKTVDDAVDSMLAVEKELGAGSVQPITLGASPNF